jgi:hypothetical protein
MTVSDRELATILAALRLFQANFAPNAEPFACFFVEHSPLSPEEIDELCERLNCNSTVV